MRIPSIQRLETQLNLLPEQATLVHQHLRADQTTQVSIIGEFFGVEYVYDANGNLAFQYFNAGDTYASTLIKRPRGDWRISTMGDEVETLERRGMKL